ncbi:MAG: class I SAM-dependent methyltransferase [Bacteroidetes bacterium]|nr:class I SAM-dependent methyltransferase [Bacteroidota bacterium]
MPSSHSFQLNEIMELIIETNPGKLLDIGVGFGKFGFLSREYLELWDPAASYTSRKHQIDGIEAFPDYLTPVHHQIYDTIYTGNALDILPGISEKYDLILMIDVLEHFTREDGMKVLELCRQKSRNVLVSVPRVMSVQEEIYGNTFETHRYNWKKKDFSFIPDKFFRYNFKSVICYIGEESGRISKIVSKRLMRRRIIRILEYTGLKKPIKLLTCSSAT